MKKIGFILNLGLTVSISVLVTAVIFLATGAFAKSSNPFTPTDGEPSLHYQGRLLDPATGNPRSDGTYPMVFSLYTAASDQRKEVSLLLLLSIEPIALIGITINRGVNPHSLDRLEAKGDAKGLLPTVCGSTGKQLPSTCIIELKLPLVQVPYESKRYCFKFKIGSFSVLPVKEVEGFEKVCNRVDGIFRFTREVSPHVLIQRQSSHIDLPVAMQVCVDAKNGTQLVNTRGDEIVMPDKVPREVEVVFSYIPVRAFYSHAELIGFETRVYNIVDQHILKLKLINRVEHKGIFQRLKVA